MNYLRTNVIKQYVNKDPQKLEVDKFYNYPYQALGKLVVNALYHRSYENSQPNEIRIYKIFTKGADKNEDTRRIEILSYLGPMPPIDEEGVVTFKYHCKKL